MPMLLHSMYNNAGEDYVHRECPDFGDVQDNETALHIALYEIAHGHSRWGCEVLIRLRAHILTTGEVKSLQWLLPQVDLALHDWCADPGPAEHSAEAS